MKFVLKTLIILLVVLGFLFSLHARVGQELNASVTWTNAPVRDPADTNNNLPHGKPFPLGSHQDAHGCYHDHDPHGAVAVKLGDPNLSSVSLRRDLTFSLTLYLSEVFHPPRV